MSYKSTRRQWVKLWVNEWLDGTTRFKLTQRQRLLWIDLLALSGRSRWPGYIFAGFGEGQTKIGYPLSWLAGTLGFEVTDLHNALLILSAQGHITLDLKDDSAIIGLVNWEKYQSEYLRQKTYRKVTTKRTSRLPVEGEEEGEVEGEAEAVIAAAFAPMNCAPYGPKKFQQIWAQEWRAPGSGTFADAMERAIQRCASLKIKVPGRFFAHKREIEKVEAEKNYKVTPL